MIFAALSNGDKNLIGSGTLLELCSQNGIPLSSSCGGKSVCGKCVVRITNGLSQLDPPSFLEQTKLEQLKCKNNVRLACQIHSDDLSTKLTIHTTYW